MWSALHYIDKEKVRALADEHYLLLLRSSDSHTLDSVGLYYTEIDPQELNTRTI
jgi:hypothetical protein